MKHAGAQTLATLEPLLRRVREYPEIKERTPGSFYRKAKGYLHFHEDAAGIFADLKLDGATFTRVRATTAQERRRLLQLIDNNLAKG